MKKPLPRPTDGELAILRVLWSIGPATVRQVCETLNQERPLAYTTVLRLLQIMLDKGLVQRDEDQRTHVYHARESEEHTQRHMLRDLLNRAFGGSSLQLVLQALSEKPLSQEERAEVSRLLKEEKP